MIHQLSYKYTSGGTAGNKFSPDYEVKLTQPMNLVGMLAGAFNLNGTFKEGVEDARVIITVNDPPLQPLPGSSINEPDTIVFDLQNPPGFWTPIQLQDFSIQIFFKTLNAGTYSGHITLIFDN